MRRLLVVNALIFAVLASAAALAYYGYSYTAEASSRERAIIQDTMRELAEEKIIGIETPMLEVDEKLFTSIDPDRLPELADVVRSLRAPVVSVALVHWSSTRPPLVITCRKPLASCRYRASPGV